MSGSHFDIAIVGASGLVGEAVLALLAERAFPLGDVHALDAGEGEVQRVACGSRMLPLQDLAGFDFGRVQLAIFCVDAEIAAAAVPRAVDAGVVVVDQSHCYRYEEDVPLVVAEVNPEAIGEYTRRGIVASPGSMTVLLATVLAPLQRTAGLQRVNVSTYQAVSGSGRKGVSALAGETARLLNGKPVKPTAYPKQIAFNLLPQVDELLENGYTREEMKIVLECRRVLADPHLRINPSAVRVPVFFGDAATIHLETGEPIDAVTARGVLTGAPGIRVFEGDYPTPVTESATHDEIFVGRIREDLTHPCGLDLWMVGDNVRRGAALNCVQIAEILGKEYL